MFRFTMRMLAAALVLGGMVLGGSAHGQNQKTQQKPATQRVEPCRPIGPAPVTGGALGQLERQAGIGPGAAVHTGVGFDGRANSRFAPRGGSDVPVRQPVIRCQPVPAPRPAPAPRPTPPAPRPTPSPKKR